MIDFADAAANEIGKFRMAFVLSPQQLLADHYIVSPLRWDSISYGENDLQRIPSNKRGVYAFVICQHDAVLPPHGYVLYIGIAGRNSDRSLRSRYKDYLNPRKLIKRTRIARMIGTWHQVLRFYFAPISDDVTSRELQQLEKQLNGALLPPVVEADLEADIKKKRRAFRL